MGKPPGMSEGEYHSPNIDHEQDVLEHGANPTITKWIYIAVVISIVALAVVMMIGHKPSGG